MRRTGTKTRLARLERRHRASAPLPPMMFVIHPQDDPGEVIGAFVVGSASVERQWSEPLNAFIGRASGELGQRFVFAKYAPEPEAEAVPVWTPAPTPTPTPVKQGWSDWRNTEGKPQ